MKFKCRFCKLVFECETFEILEDYQEFPVTKLSQCWITRRGIPHDLKPFFPKKEKYNLYRSES